TTGVEKCNLDAPSPLGRGHTNSRLGQAEGNHLPRERVAFEKVSARAACASLQGRAERRIARSGRRSCSHRRAPGGRNSLIEAINLVPNFFENLVPDFFEDLVSNNLLDALSGGVIRVEPLC